MIEHNTERSIDYILYCVSEKVKKELIIMDFLPNEP